MVVDASDSKARLLHTKGGYGTLSDVEGLDEDIFIGDGTSHLYVGVCDGPSRASQRDQLLLEGQLEQLAPEPERAPVGSFGAIGGTGGR